jgi:SAM-dependent methyltransferase
VARRVRHLPSHPKAVCPVVGTESHLLGAITYLARINPDDVLVDIGCGDGRLLTHAAAHHGCKCVGFDVRASCIEDTLQAAEAEGLSHLVTAVESDMMDESFAKLPQWQSATVVYAYLMPEVTLRIVPLLHRAVQDGKIVLLYCSSGSRIRRPNARPAGNVIGDLVPAAQAVQGKLRLYARAGILAGRGGDEIQCMPPPMPCISFPLPPTRQCVNRSILQAHTLPLPLSTLSASPSPAPQLHLPSSTLSMISVLPSPALQLHRSPTEFSSLLSHNSSLRPSASSLNVSISQAALLASRERLARLTDFADSPHEAAERRVAAATVRARNTMRRSGPSTLALTRQTVQLLQPQLDQRSHLPLARPLGHLGSGHLAPIAASHAHISILAPSIRIGIPLAAIL